MAKFKKGFDAGKSTLVFDVDPTECPFKEFRDSELATEFWGLGPAACRAAILMSKTAPRPPDIWIDDQTQPLPRSVRQYLHGWIRAEELAKSRWEAEVVICEDNNGGKMSVMDMQLSHAQVLLRSSFCRRVLSACFVLERVETMVIEHQWENFVFGMLPEGWRARYHIYSPGTKSGGGPQHRPGLSKNGCYLVRLFYLGAWRCVWVSDQVPVDATDSPLLPFSPLVRYAPTTKYASKAPATITASEVYLWPLLLCKAILKLAAPDMSSDEQSDSFEDELMPEFDIMHALTGCMNLTYSAKDPESVWNLLTDEIPAFSWDDDEETTASTVKSRSTKKPAAKETVVRCSLVTVIIEDTKNHPPYTLPGITPCHEMTLIVTIARDLPLKKPLPEPEVALWKYYRWVDWAKRHGLYEAYDCPRTRFLKVNGLMKLSYAPHLLDVQSTESITFGFREEQDKTGPTKKGAKDLVKTTGGNSTINQQHRDELKQWILYYPLHELMEAINVLFYPSMFKYTSAASTPPVRVTKSTPNRALDIPAPKSAPLYLQIDGPEENCLKISLSMLHPRILMNSGIPIMDHIEPAYVLLERFDWFGDCEVPMAKAFVQTPGYDSVEVNFLPGRHFCRLWVHSRMNWHVMLLSKSSILLGTRDLIQAAAVRECPWSSRFLGNLGSSFTNWTRVNRSNPAILTLNREFYRSYQPDLFWDPKVVGYHKELLHWMFRQALQSFLSKRLPTVQFRSVSTVLRHYFGDPDFGLPPKPKPPKSLREIANMNTCDCLITEVEEVDLPEAVMEEQNVAEEKHLVSPSVMKQLLKAPVGPTTSQVCELATDELPCGLLKDEREQMIRKHEAATLLQAHWRGTWARQCLNRHVTFSTEELKSGLVAKWSGLDRISALSFTAGIMLSRVPFTAVAHSINQVMDNAFGNLESLSALMNEFFSMYPGAKQAYSVASALSGVYGLIQHHGTSNVTPKCKWIPYFQVVFYCHGPVKVHFDIQSSLQYSTVAVFNNDTGEAMPQTYNAHLTFDFRMNNYGYTVMAHGTLHDAAGFSMDAHWQLTVLSSIEGIFHVCDNDIEGCKEQPLHPAYKLHIDEMFLPNRRNILGSITVSVTKHEAISFRAATTSPDLEIVATLRTTSRTNELQELARCTGKGEIRWPYIRLQPSPPPDLLSLKKKSMSQVNLNLRESAGLSARSLKNAKPVKPTSAGKNRSAIKIKSERPVPVESKLYHIEVTAPSGWPLTLAQWKRVDEVRNSQVEPKIELAKKPIKPTSAKERDKPPQGELTFQPLPDDAYTELECSLSTVGGVYAKRDDERDLEFAAARRAWNAKEPGRNLRGAQIRKEFRAEYLEAPPPLESTHTFAEDIIDEFLGEEDKKEQSQVQQGPTPASESGMLEMSLEIEEEAKYLAMPEQLKDKFTPLYFLPFCIKEKNEEESVLVTADMAEAAKQDRRARMEAAIERMRELQQYNELFVLGQQKRRCHLLETLFVDSQWCPELAQVLEERDKVIALETLNRTLSANKKKQDLKSKK